MSHRRNLELLEYHLECAADLMDKEKINYNVGLYFKKTIGPLELLGIKAHVHNIRDRVIR